MQQRFLPSLRDPAKSPTPADHQALRSTCRTPPRTAPEIPHEESLYGRMRRQTGHMSCRSMRTASFGDGSNSCARQDGNVLEQMAPYAAQEHLGQSCHLRTQPMGGTPPVHRRWSSDAPEPNRCPDSRAVPFPAAGPLTRRPPDQHPMALASGRNFSVGETHAFGQL